MTEWPARLSCCAQARPDGPEPTTATVFPVRPLGGSGAIQPSSQARETIASSICLIVTAFDSSIARRGAEAPGELREVVRAMQLPDRLVPAVAIDEVVPVRDEISQRAAVMAERHAALHATRALLAQLDEGQRTDELEVVADPLRGRPLRRLGTRELLEAADFAHQAASSDSDSRVKRPWPPAETG